MSSPIKKYSDAIVPTEDIDDNEYKKRLVYTVFWLYEINPLYMPASTSRVKCVFLDGHLNGHLRKIHTDYAH